MKKIEKINNQITELREEQSKVYMEAMRIAKETVRSSLNHKVFILI